MRQTINARESLDSDEILLILKEEERNANRVTNSAMFTKGKQGKAYSKLNPYFVCLLYKEYYRVSECPYLQEAKRHVQGPTNKVTKRRSPLRRQSPQRENLTTLVKQLT